MKLLAFISIAALVGFSQAASLKKTADCEDGTLCPGGCCPELNWYCCPDGQYCAATSGDCPFVDYRQKLIQAASKKASAKKVLAKSADCEDGTLCPGGCCPELNWYCCPDGQYCAATSGDCPFVAAKEALIKLAPKKSSFMKKSADCEDGTLCPGGCCPELNWYCCPDGQYCAATAGNCPFVAAKDKLVKMAAAKKIAATRDCEDGTLCPGGCCPELNWYCCPDGQYCAATAGDCPFVDYKQKLIKAAAKKASSKKVLAKSADCEDGTLCPGGCCPELNWFCCTDGLYCAATEGDCPFVAAKEKLVKMAAAKRFAATRDCEDGTLCPGGCCPELNWYCCADGQYCAATAGDCPFVASKEKLRKMFNFNH